MSDDIDALDERIRRAITWAPHPWQQEGREALDALTARANQEIEAHRLTAQAAARAEAEVERLAALVAFAREIYEAESKEWVRFADPSDPDEELPPWQGRWAKFAAALAAQGETT